MNIQFLFFRAISAGRLYLISLLDRKKLVLSGRLKDYDVALDTKIRIGNNGKMKLGSFSSESNVHLTAWGGQLEIGNGCSFNRNDIIIARKNTRIGKGTLLGPNVCIYDHDHAFGTEGIIKDEMTYGAISIGNNVWIGAGTIILKNTTIGDNCVIGAGCVVSGEIPACSLVTATNRILKITPLG